MALKRAVLLVALVLAGCGTDEREVPDVRGMEPSEAVHVLAARGLRWDGLGKDPQRDPSRIVVAQRPAAGSRTPAEAAVTLTVARGARPRRGPRDFPFLDQLFGAVRPTEDPAVVGVRVRAPQRRCGRVVVDDAVLAGEVAVARIHHDVELTARGCDRLVPRWVRVRFPGPVGGRAVVPGPILRPRPSRDVGAASWRRAEAVSTDGRTIGVAWDSGVPECFSLAGVTAEETAEEVRITLRTGAPADSDPEQACILPALPSVALVRLREPLGSRRLIDAAD